MATLVELINASTHRPALRLYIKRKLISGEYEDDWVRVDLVDGADQMIDWGGVTYEIDSNPSTDQYDFSISSLTLKISNFYGKWTNGNKATSYFFPEDIYLTRELTRIKVEGGYLDSDGTEVGTATLFEGLIEKVQVTEDRTANINCMSYLYILKQYPISDLEYTAVEKTASSIISDIFSQTKISDFITLGTNSPSNDISIEDASALDGDYWAIVSQLSLLTQSVPKVSPSGDLDFIPREPGTTSVWDFYGAGYAKPDIFAIENYDDEGSARVVMRWQESGALLFAESSNTTLKLKYLQKPSEVNLENVKAGDKQSVLDELLRYWESPRENLSFSTRFLMNEISVLDKITVSISGLYSENVPRWGAVNWGSFYWEESKGGLSITAGTEFIVTAISHSFSEWSTIIKCERIQL
jgi:hypothetical protein